MNFKKWVKSIQTAGCARTVDMFVFICELRLIWNIFLIFDRALSDVEKQNWFKMLPIKLVTKNWLISIGLLWMIKSMENPSLAVTLAMKSLVNSHGQMVLSPKLFWMAIGCWLKVSTVMQSKFQTWFDFFLKISPIFFGLQIFHYKRHHFYLYFYTYFSAFELTFDFHWWLKVAKIQSIFSI